jgi:hypothetical protein
MKKALFEWKKIKLFNKRHLVENKKRAAACLKNKGNFLFAYIHKMNSRGVPANTHGLKVTCMSMP